MRQDKSKSVFDDSSHGQRPTNATRHRRASSARRPATCSTTRVALGRFLESGLVPIDNGAVERLHVRAALTRKNFLFAGSDAGGDRAAIAYTILGCCRIVGINPTEYAIRGVDNVVLPPSGNELARRPCARVST